jgi:hypothetical protein
MKKLIIACAMLAGLSAAATAHPFNLRFESRGACEKAQALVNHFDRDNVAGPIFGIDNNGEAQVFFLEAFQCEYIEGSWRIADHRGDQSAIGDAWDD